MFAQVIMAPVTAPLLYIGRGSISAEDTQSRPPAKAVKPGRHSLARKAVESLPSSLSASEALAAALRNSVESLPSKVSALGLTGPSGPTSP